MSSGFSVEFSSDAASDLRRLRRSNRKFLEALAKRIDFLSKNPHSGKLLKGSEKSCRRLRLGDYRIIYETHPVQKVVLVIRVGHRKDIYR